MATELPWTRRHRGPLGFTTNCLFSPLMILSVLGLIGLAFAPWFALKMAPALPEIISPRGWMQTPR